MQKKIPKKKLKLRAFSLEDKYKPNKICTFSQNIKQFKNSKRIYFKLIFNKPKFRIIERSLNFIKKFKLP